MIIKQKHFLSIFSCLLGVCMSGFVAAQSDPLPSWNAGQSKNSIIEFVSSVTREGGPDFIPLKERIAVFDNDGTLWLEQPNYPQIIFAIDRVIALAPQHPKWKEQEPYKSILAHNSEALAKLSFQDFEMIIAATHSGMTVEEFQSVVKHWFETEKHPRFKRPYTETVYQPMLELLQYMRANGFKTYIVTGGGQDFVRVFAEQVYGIPPEQVVGSAEKVQFDYNQSGEAVLVKRPESLLENNKAGKPAGINLIIGRRPQVAFGNSTGDREMLEYAQSGKGKRLLMLIHHDDAEREYSYGAVSKIGVFSDELMAEAKLRNWIVVSMKNDWKRIFPFEETKKD